MNTERRAKHVVTWPTFDWWRQVLERPWMGLEPEQAGWLRVEEFHDGDELVVRAEIPGVDPEKDVEVTVADGVVRIDAHREEKTERKEKGGYRSELKYGSFSREFSVAPTVTSDDVKATYADGILEVRVPCPAKAEARGPAKVPISRG